MGVRRASGRLGALEDRGMWKVGVQSGRGPNTFAGVGEAILVSG